MANINAAVKHIRQTQRRKTVNNRVKTAFKTAIKDMKENPSDDNLKKVYSTVAKAAKKGIIKQGKADRIKSRLSKLAK